MSNNENTGAHRKDLIRPHVYLEDAVRQIAETISVGINCGLMLDATT